MVELAGPPGRGRVLTARRRVRSADADAAGVLRLDGVARYAQDIAFDDLHDAAQDGAHGAWVLRRTVIEVHRLPVFHDLLQVRTWCSGIGPRWCSKRTTLSCADGARVEVEGFWVNVDPATGRPAPLSPELVATFAVSAAAEPLRWRRALPVHPLDPDHAAHQHFPLRVTDVDWLGHVNNATCWTAVEQALAGRRGSRVHAVLEHSAPITLSDHLEVLTETAGDTSHVWLVVAGDVRAVARVRPRD